MFYSNRRQELPRLRWFTLSREQCLQRRPKRRSLPLRRVRALEPLPQWPHQLWCPLIWLRVSPKHARWWLQVDQMPSLEKPCVFWVLWWQNRFRESHSRIVFCVVISSEIIYHRCFLKPFIFTSLAPGMQLSQGKTLTPAQFQQLQLRTQLQQQQQPQAASPQIKAVGKPQQVHALLVWRMPYLFCCPILRY